MATKKTDAAKAQEEVPYADPFGGDGLLYANKDELVAKRLVFDINSVEYQANQGYKGAERWLLEIEVVQNGLLEIQYLTLGTNEKRDERMNKAVEALETTGEPLKGYTLVKVKDAFYVNRAPSGEVKPRTNRSAPTGARATTWKQNPELAPQEDQEIPF